MNNPDLQAALKWGIENSSVSATAETAPRTQLTAESVAALFAGGNRKTDLDYMEDNMKVMQNADVDIENRKVACDNFEQLIEHLDNANNLESRGLWQKLIALLDDKEADIRGWAAWLCSTAVQNNIRTQERLLICGAVPTLVRLATQDTKEVRKKATSALSSTVRNFQPGLDETLLHMPDEYKPTEKLDAHDMESVDILINKLRDSLQGSS